MVLPANVKDGGSAKAPLRCGRRSSQGVCSLRGGCKTCGKDDVENKEGTTVTTGWDKHADKMRMRKTCGASLQKLGSVATSLPRVVTLGCACSVEMTSVKLPECAVRSQLPPECSLRSQDHQKAGHTTRKSNHRNWNAGPAQRHKFPCKSKQQCARKAARS